MIEYQPNRDWLRDLLHLGTSWTLRRIARMVLAIGLYAASAVAVILGFGLEQHTLNTSVFSLLGVILSIILVFRTNTAYDRWWEGRKQWGSLINESRNLAIQVDASFPADDAESRRFFARQIASFAASLVDHLRDGAGRASLIDPDDEDLAALGRGANVPASVVRRMVLRAHEARRDGRIDGFDLLALKAHTREFLNIQGACERIRKTPIPFSYNAFIKFYVVTYGLVLPFGLAPDYGVFAVPLTMFIFFALVGVELMAGEIEEPFGLDCNDLPTGSLARAIRRDAEAILTPSSARPAEPEPAPYAKVF